ncbi:MAG TPA: glycoside hydrolase family 5 protein [Anaeromyxobacter sp.]|nr:glycoside hydrolase family 5 protein [Anaeromyxobacter sp.]
MKLQLRSTLAVLLVSSLVMGCGGDSTDVHGPSTLGRGINMGNYLEADGHEGAWTGERLIDEENDFPLIRAAGFESVRIPIRWSDHASTTGPEYLIDADFLARVKEVVDGAIAAGLKVVINTHHYTEMMDGPVESLPGHRARLAAIWDQIAKAFPVSSYPADTLVFELLNEPNGRVGYSQWNDIIEELTNVLWTDNAATQTGRKIMVGTANWGGPTGLQQLVLPRACNPGNTIITIHWYEPFHFTHQGAEWVAGSDAWIGTRWTGTAADKAALLTLLDTVTFWNSQKGRRFEIYVGEFGAYGAYAEPEDRRAWTAFVAREAEARNMSWAYWEFDQGFGAYDRDNTRWRPEIIEALIPVEPPPQ